MKKLVLTFFLGLLIDSASAQKIILAKVELRQDTDTAFYDQTVDLVRLTRKEPGCVSFNIHKEAGKAATLVIHEIFFDENAFKAHLQKPYVLAWFKRLDEVKTAPIEVIKLEPLN